MFGDLLGTLAVSLFEFSGVVLVFALMTGLVVSALIEIGLRPIVNVIAFSLFRPDVSVENFWPERYRLGTLSYWLPYRQFCGRVLTHIDSHPELGFRPESLRGDTRQEELRRHRLEVEFMVDELQVWMGTIWSLFLYVACTIFSLILAVLLDGSIDEFAVASTRELMDTSAATDLDAVLSAQRSVFYIGAVLSGIIAPLGIKLIERGLAQR